MRLTSFFLFAACLSASARAYDQTVTLSETNATLNKVFQEIKKQTDFKFVYTEGLLKKAKTVTINITRAPLEQVLNICFEGQPLSYTILNKMIIIKERIYLAGDNIMISLPPLPIRGKVVNDKGEPMAGATIMEKGGKRSVRSADDGNFVINVDGLKSVLIISYVGYLTQEISVNNQTNITVALMQADVIINDVVVIGYGTQSKRNLTSSISSLSAKDVQDQPVQQIGQALQGKVAGVQIMQNSGAPGSSLIIRIRGTGTVNNSEPLYVIDGNLGASPSNLDPDQIESMEVLKSASASAIYGALGANGVIIITTKKGIAGKPVIQLNTYAGIQQNHRMLPLVNAKQYATLYNTALTNGGRPPLFDNVESLGEGVNWQKEIFRTVPIFNVEVSASGGTDKGTYYIAGGYFQQKGTVINTDYSRINFRINSEYKVKPSITIGENISLSYEKRNVVPSEFDGRNPIANSWHMDPTVPVKNADGSWGYPRFSDTKNPVAEATLYNNVTKDPIFNGSAYVKVDIIRGLVFRSQINMNMGFYNTYLFTPTFDIFPLQRNLITSVSRTVGQLTNWDWQNTLTYKRTQGAHNLEILGGVTSLSNRLEFVTATGQNVPLNANTDPNLRYLDLTTTGQVGGSAGEFGMLSFLGRVNYGFKGTYLFTGNFRMDGSSKFGNNNRFGSFPSFSIGWRISNEPFLKNISFINDLKIRAGWGMLGNQNSLSNYAFANAVSPNINYVFGENVANGQAATSAGNPNLKWETTNEKEIGIDFIGFGNRLTLSAAYYNKSTTNMLLRVPIPAYTGIQTAPFINGGDVNNKGFEFLLAYQKRAPGKFQYDVSVNFSNNINKVTKLSNSQAALFAGDFSRTVVGGAIGAFYGYVMDGIFQTQEEVDKHAFQTQGTSPGDIRFKDLNGDNVINQNDRTTIGNPWPKWSYGLSSNLHWNQFDLNITLYGVYGNDIAANWKYFTEGSNFYNKDTYMLQSWNGEGSSNSIPRLNVDDPNDNLRNSSYYIDKGSYIRLKNVQLGYSFPRRLFNTIQNLRIYMSCQNLLTFTKYRGFDPEIGSPGSTLIVGTDEGYYPQPRVITAGVRMTF